MRMRPKGIYHTSMVLLENIPTGNCIKENNDEMVDIQRRINLGNEAYFALTNVMKSRPVHRKNKILLDKTIIQPICYMEARRGICLTKRH